MYAGTQNPMIPNLLELRIDQTTTSKTGFHVLHSIMALWHCHSFLDMERTSQLRSLHASCTLHFGKKSRCKRDLVESMLFSISNSSVALMAVVQLGVEKSTL